MLQSLLILCAYIAVVAAFTLVTLVWERYRRPMQTIKGWTDEERERFNRDCDEVYRRAQRMMFEHDGGACPTCGTVFEKRQGGNL